ncbi:hypothetical protein ACTXT7_013311 [Hymenolepis weldensis]
MSVHYHNYFKRIQANAFKSVLLERRANQCFAVHRTYDINVTSSTNHFYFNGGYDKDYLHLSIGSLITQAYSATQDMQIAIDSTCQSTSVIGNDNDLNNSIFKGPGAGVCVHIDTYREKTSAIKKK